MSDNNPKGKNIIENSHIEVTGNFHQGDVTYINKYFAGKEVKIPHRLTNYIPTNAEYIIGRDIEMETITKYLEAKKPTVLVNGIGGIGKTSVAIKYMAIHGAEYKHLAWITVQSSILETFISNSALLESLQITEKVQDLIIAKQLDNAFELVFHQLNILEKTLVVLDNANDLEDLEKYEHLFDTASCHFLITSRTYPSEWTTIAIDSLPEEEALRLFKKLHPSVQASDEAIKSLLSKLFYHTLLIELVAKSIESSAYVFEELQEIIDTQFIHHESLNQDAVSTGKHGAVVKDNLKRSKIEDYIWLIFSKVKGLEDKSKNILKSIALFPLALLMERSQLKEHLTFFDVENPMPTLTMLVERGWVDKAKGLEDNTYYKMHPLVADVVVEHLDVDAHYADNYIKHIANLMLYNTIDSNNKLLEKKLCNPFAERLVSLFYSQNTERVAELLYQLNWYNQQLGYYDKALCYSERSLQIAESLSDIDAHIVARGQNTLAVVYRELERYAEAAVLLEKALILGEKQFGKEHPSVATRQSNLAVVYQDLGRYAEATKLLEQALNTDEKIWGKEHPKVAIDLSILGLLYKNLGRYQESAEQAEKALIISEKNFGNEHPTVAVRQFNLAIVYQELGRELDAQVLFQKAYQIRLNFFGENHSFTQKAKERIRSAFLE
jgi:tetratricopeptide (TPR) repeat protein